MPLSYQVADTKDMNHFKNDFNENQTYILKKHIQQKKGINLMKGNYNKIKRTLIIDNYKVIQTYLNTPFLINRRKVNLRVYLAIICYPANQVEKPYFNQTKNNTVNNTNNNQTITKYYLYKEGKCIYTNQDYSENIENIESHLTSVNLNESIYNINPESFDDLSNYLGSETYNNLWNNILHLMTKTKIATQNNICRYQNINKSIRFQLFGGDIILSNENNNLKPYLLEFNKGPSMKYVSPNDEKLKNTII